MAEPTEPLVKIAVGRGQPELVLPTVEDVTAFVAKEQEFWRILDRGDATAAPDPIRDFPKATYNRIGSLLTTLNQYNADPSGQLAQLKRSFQKLYGESSNQLPTSTSPDGQLLKVLKAKLPEIAFNVAVQSVIRRGPFDGLNLSLPDHQLGVVAVAAYRLGLSEETAVASQAALAELATNFQDTASNEIAQQRAAKEEWSKFSAEAQVRFQGFLDLSETKFGELSAAKSAEVDQAITGLKAVDQTYREKLQLEAPTMYWTKKRKRHRMLAALFGAVCALYAGFAALLIWLGLSSEFDSVLKLPADTNWAPYVLLVARGLFLSVILFWVGRILVRMFLSQLHLSMDAHERSTMVMTYLALTQDGKITPEERPLVLQPLFRPSSDGIVKDDGSTDPVLSALLARAVPPVPR